MVYNRYVQIGRVVLVDAGPNKGKLAVIVDVVDQNRALVDGPTTGVARQALAFRAMCLTKFVVKLCPSAGTSVVKRAFEAGDVAAKWEATAWAKKIAAKARRASLTDFERFEVQVKKQKRSRIIKREYAKLKAAAKLEAAA